MFLNILFLFQTSGEEVTTESFNLLSLIMKGGPLGIVVLAVLLLLSIMALYVFIERYLTIKRASEVDESFMANIRSHVQSGNIDAAMALCQTTDTPIARMIEKGVKRIGKPLQDISVAIENVGNLEVSRLENRLSLLATISGSAPMIGFFGTVTGMIIAFYTMATANDVTPTALAGGIYQALLTTAFGLLIGIVSFIGYNYLVARVEKVIFQMEASSVEFIDLLQEPAH